MALDLTSYDIPHPTPTTDDKVIIIRDAMSEVAVTMPPGAFVWFRENRRSDFDTIMAEQNTLDTVSTFDDLAAIRSSADRCRRLWLRAWDIYRQAMAADEPPPPPTPPTYAQGVLL